MILGTIETTLLLVLATLFLGGCTYLGFKQTKDPLFPAVIIAPLFFFGMVLEPARCLLHPDLVEFFPEYRGIAFAMTVQYVGILFFFLGIFSLNKPLRPGTFVSSLVDLSIDATKRRKIRVVAWSLALSALAGYWYGIYLLGGFVKAYSRNKGGNASMSGYFGEAQNLGVAAVVFYAISLQGARLKLRSIFAALLMMSPTILQATLGGRRGPLFIAGASLFASYFIAIGRVPKMRAIIAMLMVLIVGVIFIGSQRRNLHFGSERGLNWDDFQGALLGTNIESGDNFVVSSGAVLAINDLEEYHYGRRFFMTFFVRPIPKDLWPSKYNDVSEVLYGKPFKEIQNFHYGWIDVLDWRPTNGYAINAIADLFWEFGWGYVIALWLLGRGIVEVWYRFRNRGGFWFVGYFLLVALTIYLPTQSFSAFAHRFLYLSVMSFIFWKVSMGIEQRRARFPRAPTRRSNPMPRPPLAARSTDGR